MLVSVNTKELEYILENTPASQNIMIAGKHGIGKSEIVKSFFTNKGLKVVTVFCSQAADPGDIIGLPKYNEETGLTEFALPWWFPTDGKPVVLFLDELNRARPEILQVVMDLTLNRRLAGRSLPEGSRVISAVNDGDEYLLTEMDPALQSRFNIYTFVPSVDDWLAWAKLKNLNKDVISFISGHNKLLDSVRNGSETIIDKSYDRRAWERVSDIMNGYNGRDFDSMFRLLCGVVGSYAAGKFKEFLDNNNLVDPLKILRDFNSVETALKGRTLSEYTAIIDNLLSTVNAKKMDDDLNNQTSEDLKWRDGIKKFLELLCSSDGNREAMSYFIIAYENATYPAFNIFIALDPSITEYINNFVMTYGTAK